MSRIMGFLITLFHVVGGSLTGYYAYFLRVQVEGGAILDVATLTTLISENALLPAGPMIIIITVLLHRFEIVHARTSVSRANLAVHRHAAHEEELEQKLKAQESTFKWVRQAIDEAVAKEALQSKDPVPLEKPKDYYENDEHPSA